MQMTIGQYLRAHREHMGYRLEDVSASINIRAAQLRAIENGQIEMLPGMTYAVGFVKTYASFLNLDANAVAQKFREEHADGIPVKNKKKIKKTITDDPYSDNRVPGLPILGVALLFLLMCFSVWWFLKPDMAKQVEALNQVPPPPVVETASDNIEIPVSELPSTEQEAPDTGQSDLDELPDDDADTIEAVAAEEPIKPLALSEKEELKEIVDPPRIVISAMETTWVEIMDGSRRSLYRQLLQKGDSFAVPNSEFIYLSTGNAGALTYAVDGKKLLPIGATGDILREIKLTPEILLEKSQ